MSTLVVVGSQWGDEGKGKITDLLSEEADIIVRYQGGCNAGHTVVKGDEQYIFHLIPPLRLLIIFAIFILPWLY